jgi:hypothetical protein
MHPVGDHLVILLTEDPDRVRADDQINHHLLIFPVTDDQSNREAPGVLGRDLPDDLIVPQALSRRRLSTT